MTFNYLEAQLEVELSGQLPHSAATWRRLEYMCNKTALSSNLKHEIENTHLITCKHILCRPMEYFKSLASTPLTECTFY